MPTILDTILEHKRREVDLLRATHPAFGARTTPRRPFLEALDRAPEIAVIAEVKKASPSKGLIREDFEPVDIAQSYERGGARAVSVLTDERSFQGRLSYLLAVRQAVSLPVLRKDFIIDPLQVEQTAHAGADAMLLIAAALSDQQMAELFTAACELDVEPLVEVHNATELERAMRLSPPLIGINNRDLATFECSLGTTIALAGRIADKALIVAESGIESGEQTGRLRDAGVGAVLVGESLMRLTDPAPKIRELSHAGEG